MAPKKRVMDRFRIDELSIVDAPAQREARILVAKAHNDTSPSIRHLTRKVTMDSHRDDNHDEDDMDRFEALIEHYKRSGMSGTIAMRMAKDRRPDLLQKMQDRQHQPTDDEAAIAKARSGRARQNEVQAAVDDLARSSGITKMEAARQLRQERPGLFA